MYYFDFVSNIGKICLIGDENELVRLDLAENIPINSQEDMPISIGNLPKNKQCLEQAYIQITEYLAGKRKQFDLPLQLKGTQFQCKVWRELIKIPYKQTITYKELAKKVGNPKAYRAVANVCAANKLPIIIPCHRVITSGGKLGGYSLGIELKKQLLNLEQNN